MHRSFAFITLCLSVVVTQTSVFSQVSTEPELAAELQKSYKDFDIASLGSYTTYAFSVDKSGVTITETRIDSLIALESAHTQFFAGFYDETSAYQYINEWNSKGKSKSLSTTDDYYHDDIYFHSDVRVIQYSLSFVKAGDIRVIETSKVYRDPKYFTKIFFHEIYPVRNMRVELIVPNGFDLETKEFFLNDFGVDHDIATDADGTRHFVYQAKDLIPFPDESNTDGRSLIYPHIIVLTKSYHDSKSDLRFFVNTADVYNWYKELVDQVSEDEGPLRGLVDQLTAGESPDMQIRNIYYWVQNNIRYIAFEDGIAGYRPESCQEVYAKRYGDCKGMANLTKHMLKVAGFDARLVWIGTRQIGYDYSIPSLAVDNHMICAVNQDTGFVFLDATEKFGAFGEYSERIQGKQAMIEDGDKFILKRIPGRTAEDNIEVVKRDIKLDEALLTGKVTETFHGESKADMLYQFNYLSKDKMDEAIQRYVTDGNKRFSANAISLSDVTRRDQPLELTYDWTVRNAVTAIDNEIYIDLNQRKFFNNAMFEKDRKLDFVFPFKYSIEDETTLEIPTGYEVVELPPGVSISNPDFRISVDVNKEDGKILYRSKIAFPTARISKKHFDAWNTAMKELKESYSHQVVLSKPD